MSQSTPLDKIESDSGAAAANDEMRVQRILQEINGGGDESPGHQGQSQQGQGQHYQEQGQGQGQAQHQGQHQGQGQGQGQQVPYHMYQPPHMPPQPPLMGPGMVPYDMMHQQQQSEEQEYMQNLAAQAAQQNLTAQEEGAKKKNIWGRLTDAFKLPFVVACVFFILSLPVVDVQLSKYAHWAFSSGGQLSMTGIALKAVVAGTVMGVYDTIDSLVSRLF